ncbi:MAG: thioesterase family protein, partial [Myxococcota bacterium]|nr:thioesterase family protein [Myxococcota bacterium]
MTDPDPTPEPAGATRFDRDTAVSHLGDGRYEARLDRGWWIIRGPNGGYLAAILTRAMQARVGDPSRH